MTAFIVATLMTNGLLGLAFLVYALAFSGDESEKGSTAVAKVLLLNHALTVGVLLAVLVSP